MKLSKNFWLWEFMPPELYDRLNHGILRKFMDDRVIEICQTIRNKTGKGVYINTWKDGGHLQLSGFRPFDTAIGAKYSQHKFGRAADIKVVGIDPYDLRKWIRKHYKKHLQPIGLTRMETNTNTWTHIDVAFTGSGGLVTFDP